MTEPVGLDGGNIVLWNADCLDILPTLEPGSVDAVVTDPPYGISHAHNSLTERRPVRPIAGDEDQSLGIAALEWAETIPVITFASPKLPWPGVWRNRLVWDKGPAVGGGGDTSLCLKATWELIQVARNGPISGKRESSVIRHWVTPDLSAEHPSAKPIPLVVWLINKFLNCCQSILDPFMGSGTTGVACVRTGRKFIGIELDPGYFQIAVDRIQKELDQRDGSGPLMRARPMLIEAGK